jgi:HPr kinase/phosphorylase
MEVMGIGVVITGDAAIGKSELALELITRGHRLIADDIVEIYEISPDTLEGRCPMLLQDFIEVRGLGILNIRALYGEVAVKPKKTLRFIVHLENPPTSIKRITIAYRCNAIRKKFSASIFPKCASRSPRAATSQ